MSAGQKALRACADYARLNTEIRSLTREIGDCLAKCKGVDLPPSSPNDLVTIFANAASDETHLKRLYRGVSDDDDYLPTIRHLSDKEIHARLLDECPHCLGAHHAIRMRKATRRRLGAAKRSITMLGRAATKEPV